jgi:hypothetical protein
MAQDMVVTRRGAGRGAELTAETATTDVLEIEDPSELVAGDAVRVVDSRR